MSSLPDHASTAQRGAALILTAFEDYQQQFLTITRRAKTRFEQRDWHGMQEDAVERLELYGRVIDRVEANLRESLGQLTSARRLWAAIKAQWSWHLLAYEGVELAETFFNSVTRRILGTVGVDPEVEFRSDDFDVRLPGGDPVYWTFPGGRHLPEAIKDVLAASSFSIPFEDVDRDARLVARAIHRERRLIGATRPIDAIDVVRRVFYRGKGAFVVGRVCSGDEATPLALAIRNGDHGLYVDAALLTANEINGLFGFTRAYFHVEVDRPHALVTFLKSLMPRKPVSELYTAIGLNKHGKTELYRGLMRHLKRSDDKFEVARGEKGMVMIVFTLPSFDVVFKVIRDTFAYPKTVTRREVMYKYQLVFKHDRAGRLADAQEFEHLAFPRDRFSDELLAEFARDAAQTNGTSLSTSKA
jgi:isocitrate dehydrogenase kinase/phosphatase